MTLGVGSSRMGYFPFLGIDSLTKVDRGSLPAHRQACQELAPSSLALGMPERAQGPVRSSRPVLSRASLGPGAA